MDASRSVFWTKFTRFRGDTKRLRFTLTDDRGHVLDPDDHTLFFNVDGLAGEPLVQKQSTIGGFYTIDGAAGVFEIEMLPADDDALPDNNVAYDCVVVAQHNTTGAVHRLRASLRLVDGILPDPEITLPTTVIQPAPGFLGAQEIEANRLAAEAAAAAAAASAAEAAEAAGGGGASVQLTFTGQFRASLVIALAPPNVVVPGLTTEAGTKDYTAIPGVYIAGFSYTEPVLGPEPITSLTFDNLLGVGGTFNPNSTAALTTLSAPVLQSIGGGFGPNNMAALTTLSFPALQSIGGNFSPTNMPALTTLDLSSLQSVGTIFAPGSLAALTTLSLPALQSVGDNFVPSNMGALTTLSFPALQSIGGNFNPSTMGALVTLDFSSLQSVRGLVALLNTPALTTLDLSSLQTVGGNFNLSNMALTTLDLSSLQSVAGNFNPVTMPALTTLDLSSLQSVTGIFNPSTMAALTTLDLSSLQSVGSTFGPGSMAALTTLSLPALQSVGVNFVPSNMGALTTLSAPVLQSVGGIFGPGSMAALTTLSLPALQSVAGNFNPVTMAAATTISFPAMVTYGSTITIPSATMANVSSCTLGTVGTLKSIAGATITLSGLKIPSANVNAILALLVSLDGTNGTTLWGAGKTLTINGGTNGAPTGQGATDKATLQARGATVTTN